MRSLFPVAALLILAVPTAAAEQPNVLFIAVDDLKPALGCYDDPHAKTPNLDKLATRGTVFLRAYCQQAVCSPSRSSLLTGRRPDTTKVYDLDTHFRKALPDVVTLPQQFKANGYHTQGIGKIYHGGFEDPPSWSVPWEGTKKPGYGPDGMKLIARLTAEAKAKGVDLSNWRKRPRGYPTEAPDVADNALADGALADRAVELLQERKEAGKPFFLAVGFIKPHLPFVAPKKYWDLYDPAKLPMSDNSKPPTGAPSYAPQFGGELRNYHEMPKSGPIPKEDARKLVHGYYAAVSYMDAQIGRVLDALQELGLADNTVVVVWGDHGWHLGDHGMWCKHTNYEQATRSALLMAAPGQKVAGKKSAALVEFVDVYPTLVELCKLPDPGGLEGHSFAPLLDDPRSPWKPAALSQYPRGGGKGVGALMGYALRTDRYRLVEWRDRSTGKPKAYELYDHETDPGESVNLAAQPEHKDTVARLAGQLAAGWKGNAPPAR